jgi:hypothetical protein
MEIQPHPHAGSIYRPLLRLLFASSILFALLIFVSQAFGSTQPPPTALAGLHLTECALPCWMGMTPGQTDMLDAVHRLESAQLGGMLFESSDGRSVTTAYPVTDALVRVDIVADEAGKVVQITIFTAPVRGLRLGDAVHYLGTPTCNGGNRAMALYTGTTADAVVVGSAPLGKSGLRTALNYIDIYDHSYDLHPCAIPAN